MNNKMMKGAFLALLLGGLGACAPDQGNTEAAAVGSEGAEVSLYESMVANKPVAEVGQPFAMQAHKKSTKVSNPAVVSEGFDLRLDLPKGDFVLGEPVIVQATLTNTSNRAMEIAPLLDVVFDNFQVEVTLPDGSVQPYRSMIEACTLPKVAIQTLQPGETFSNDVKIFAPKGGWLFAEPGDYTINAKLRGMTDDAQLVVAEAVELTVLKGTPNDQAVANMIMDGQAAILLDWRDGDQLDRGRATLETIVRDYPDTIHAIYAGHVLGNIWSDDFATVDGARPADFKKAVSYLVPAFERIISADAPVVSPDVVSGTLMQLLISQEALGLRTDMDNTIQDFADAFGHNPAFNTTIDNLRKRPGIK